MNVVVTGGSGTIGRELVRQLVASKRVGRIRVLTRNPQASKMSLERVELVAGDLTEPRTLAPAFEGMDKAFVLTSGIDLARLERNAVDAAKAARVRQVVKLSALEAFEPYLAGTGLAIAHSESEAYLRESGLGWTMVRPGSFSSNVVPGGPLGVFIHDPKQGEVRLPAGNGTEVPIDPHDIAAVSLLALLDERGDTLSKVYEITGGERLTYAEMFAKMAPVWNTDLRHVDCTEEEARTRMLAVGAPSGYVESVIRHFAVVRADGLRKTDEFAELLGRRPRTFDEWVRGRA